MRRPCAHSVGVCGDSARGEARSVPQALDCRQVMPSMACLAFARPARLRAAAAAAIAAAATATADATADADAAIAAAVTDDKDAAATTTPPCSTSVGESKIEGGDGCRTTPCKEEYPSPPLDP
jgi:hypothetical protein